MCGLLCLAFIQRTVFVILLFIVEYYSIVWLYHILKIHLPVDKIFGCFCLGVMMGNATTNNCIYVFARVYIISCGEILRSGTIGSYSKLMFNFLGNCQTIAQCCQNFTALPAKQFLFLHLLLNTCCFRSFLLVNLVGLQWYLSVTLICISLMTEDVQYLFRSLLVICVPYLMKYIFRSSSLTSPFLFGVFLPS